jgi:hypothetical protein
MKKCKKCNISKELSEFAFRGGGKKKAQCKLCYNSNWKYRLISTLSTKKTAKNNPLAKRNGKIHYVEDNINGAFLEELQKKQNGMCYWLKIPMDFTLKDRLRKPSLDRLDNNIGYTKSNIVLTTLFANTGRRDATIEEMATFLKNHFPTMNKEIL